MSRPDCLKEKDEKSNWRSVDNHDEDSATRTRSFSFEEIMSRRKNKELLENVKDPAKEAWNKSPEGSLEKIADHIESPRIYKHHKFPSFNMEKHASEELVNVSSRKKVKSTIVTKDDLTEGRDRTNNILETKSRAGLNSKGWITEEKTREQRRGQNKAGNKHSRDSDNKDSYAVKDTSKSERKIKKKNHNEEEENHNEHYTERKHGKDRHDGGEIKRLMSNDFEEVPEKKHYRDSDKHIHTEGRAKYGREINKETRAKYEREIKRKYRNDDETQDRNAMRKQDIAKHHNPHIYERKSRQEKVKSHYEEPTMKRRRSRSREREDRRRPRSLSPRAHRNTYQDGERKDLSVLSLTDSSRKKHSDDKNRVSTNGSSRRSRSRERDDRRRSTSFSPRAHRKAYQDGERKDLSMLSLTDSSRKKHSDDKNRLSTNGSSRRSKSREREDRRRSPSFSPRAHRKTYQDGERKDLSMLSLSDSSRKKHSDDKTRASTNDSNNHHRRYRHSSPASGLGGYSPRKRKSETDKKTPSPSKDSPEKKRAGWDLPPVGTDPTLALVSSGFELSNHSVLSSMHDLASATSLNPSIVKPLPVSFFNAVSTGKNDIDSVQLTQATRPMRRVYLENLPASASEKVVMDCFNNLLLSSGANHIQQTRPCISCTVSL